MSFPSPAGVPVHRGTSVSSLSSRYISVTQHTAVVFLEIIKLFNHNYSFILGFLSSPPDCLEHVFSGTVLHPPSNER